MNTEFEPSGNEEMFVNVNPHTEEKVSADTLPAHRSPFLSAPENQPFRELLLEFDQYFERWHRVLSAPEYLVEHTEDLVEHTKKKKQETWLRGFDIVQSGAHLQVVPLTKKQQERPEGGVVRITSEAQYGGPLCQDTKSEDVKVLDYISPQ